MWNLFWKFSRKFKKINFGIFTHIHFKLKLKDLWLTVLYKRNRSNTENIECRPVMSLLQLPLTNDPILSSNHPEWRTLCLRSAMPVFLILCIAPPFCLALIYFCCIFRYTPVFWPGTLCSDFKDVSHQNYYEHV